VLAAAALAAGAISCRPRQPPPEEASAVEAPAAAPVPPVRVLYPAAPGSFVDLASELRASVVHLASTARTTGGSASLLPRPEPSEALGSGFFVDVGGRTFVLTNDHVIAGAPEVRVLLADGTALAAKVVGRDGRLDVALLEVDASPRLRPARLGSSEHLQVGEWVVALGNPFGAEIAASAGIVSARSLSDRDELVRSDTPPLRSFLVTDAAIHAGNSGGPLVNMAGEVVGINTAVPGVAAGIGLAVPIDRARQVLPMLEKEGRVTRAWLGMKIHPVNPELTERLGVPTARGALVSEVVPDGPAARAGIRRGDVVLSFDGRDVDHFNLPWLVSSSGLGPKAIVLWRDRGERHLTVLAEKMPD
jgi:serine protease Do